MNIEHLLLDIHASSGLLHHLLGVEVKKMDAPTLTPSMRIALEDLNLEQLVVLYPGPRAYTLAERVRVVPLSKLAEGDARDLFPQPRKAGAKTAG